MPITSPQKLRTRFDIKIDIVDARLELCIGAASRKLKRWVGETVYADAVAPNPIDGARAEDLEMAESFLTMHFAILGLNSPITPFGVVKSEKAEDNAVISYFTPRETRELSEQFLGMAKEIAEPYYTTILVLGQNAKQTTIVAGGEIPFAGV